uniref:Uncharacterized protein n=1 Tax=Anguilla anguilla TaxID=7936 RepID=A0A0E9WA33_ANGAN
MFVGLVTCDVIYFPFIETPPVDTTVVNGRYISLFAYSHHKWCMSTKGNKSSNRMGKCKIHHFCKSI